MGRVRRRGSEVQLEGQHALTSDAAVVDRARQVAAQEAPAQPAGLLAQPQPGRDRARVILRIEAVEVVAAEGDTPNHGLKLERRPGPIRRSHMQGDRLTARPVLEAAAKREAVHSNRAYLSSAIAPQRCTLSQKMQLSTAAERKAAASSVR